MKIKLVLPEEEAQFIRHARTETLKDHGDRPYRASVEPTPWGLYLVAFDETNRNRPIGMVELAFLDQIYHSFEESPYPRAMNLDQLCPIKKMTGIRTIYVEPGYRRQARSIYLQLILAAARTVWALGARFVTATADVEDHYLNRLYTKTGGWALDTVPLENNSESSVTAYLFDVGRLLENKLVKRGTTDVEIDIDPQVALHVRSRNVLERELQCA